MCILNFLQVRSQIMQLFIYSWLLENLKHKIQDNKKLQRVTKSYQTQKNNKMINKPRETRLSRFEK